MEYVFGFVLFCFWFFWGGFLWELLKRLIQLSEMLLQLQFISNLLRPCGHWGRCCTAEWNFFPVIVTFVRLIVLILSWDTQRESFSLLCLPSCCHTLSDDSFLFIFLCGKNPTTRHTPVFGLKQITWIICHPCCTTPGSDAIGQILPCVYSYLWPTNQLPKTRFRVCRAKVLIKGEMQDYVWQVNSESSMFLSLHAFFQRI